MVSDKEKKKKKAKIMDNDYSKTVTTGFQSVSDSSDSVISPVAPFSANIRSPTAPRTESVVAKVGPSSVGHSVNSDPIMDEALETLKAVNREQLGLFMQSFSKFIDSRGQMSEVVSPGSTNQAPVTAMEDPEGSSSAPVEYIETVTTGCQFSKQQPKSLDPLVLKDLNSTFRDTKDAKGHNKSKVPRQRKVSVAPSSSSSSGNDHNDTLNDSFTTVSTSRIGVYLVIYFINFNLDHFNLILD